MISLGDAGVDSPRRDCLVFLEDLLKKDRTWVLSHHEKELNKEQLKTLEDKINRRLKREPLAYIRGKAWFYGRFFAVDKNAMIPRPESEAFIGLLKNISPDLIIDIGTGSGAIAITAALELSKPTKIIATDSSSEALKIAKLNAASYKVSIELHEGSLLEPIDIKSSDSVIATNLPYVPESYKTSPEIKFEPKQAIFSGKEGLDHYREFWRQIGRLQIKPKHILCESLKSQHGEMSGLAKNAGYHLRKSEILVQQFEIS
jgi:release factor glutamine methyltransferase